MALTSRIPRGFANLSFLVSLDMGSNNFQGNLPREMAHLRQLKFLDSSVNSFNGKIPSWFGFLHQIQVLNLRNNSFTGSIASSFSNMSTLETLNMNFNSIEGKIPKVIGKLINLRVLKLEGIVPQEIENLNNLMELLMQKNQITGSVPISIFNISSLQILSLWKNNLSGFLPREIGNLTKMQILQLSGNKLIGKMTNESQMMDAITFVGATNIGTSSCTNASPTMTPAEKPKKFSGIDFKRWQNYILSGLQDDLYNVYSGPKTSKELWGELQVIIHDLLAEGLIVNDVFQVAAIVEKLPPLWKDFKNYLKHKGKVMTVEELIIRLRIEEDNEDAKRRKKIEQGSNQPKKKFKGKFVNYGKIGHKSTDCRAPKKGKKKDQANMIESNKECGDLCAMFSECNLTGNPREWCMDSGATLNVCANKEFCFHSLQLK
ncbi:hypothetical protein T459_32529 [Capsicum annuum]|uniref:Uncharacterized protein n=1 Tax=Capsicum annuum TaxID=4072 RepID=A0A2G2Y1I1_CAPAN|nr:hypothetical protein T459_32529 [Capsicum annuum]